MCRQVAGRESVDSPYRGPNLSQTTPMKMRANTVLAVVTTPAQGIASTCDACSIQSGQTLAQPTKATALYFLCNMAQGRGTCLYCHQNLQHLGQHIYPEETTFLSPIQQESVFRRIKYAGRHPSQGCAAPLHTGIEIKYPSHHHASQVSAKSYGHLPGAQGLVNRKSLRTAGPELPQPARLSRRVMSASEGLPATLAWCCSRFRESRMMGMRGAAA